MKVCLACGVPFESHDWRCPECGNYPGSSDGFLAFSSHLAHENESFSAKYFARLAQLETENFWFRARNRLLVWALDLYFHDATSFLEIGCGTGFVLSEIQREFPNLKLSGSDIFTAGLPFASRRPPGVSLSQMDARSLPFIGEFDAIGAFDVLEHIREDELVLRQMYEAIKPGGGIIITVPQHPSLWSPIDDYSYHKRRYGREGLIEKVKSAGFKIRRVSSFVSLLLPFMLLSRARQRKCRSDPFAEFRLGRSSNRLLEKIMGIERVMIKAGVDFPAGGSLLLIAGKRTEADVGSLQN